MEGITKKQKLSTLDQLKEITVVVADTGDFEGNYCTFFLQQQYVVVYVAYQYKL